jgi:hypothetical protein
VTVGLLAVLAAWLVPGRRPAPVAVAPATATARVS